MPTFSTCILQEAAQKRGWHTELIDEKYAPILIVTLPDGSRHYIGNTLISQTSAVGVLVNRNKLATYRIAERLGIPVAEYTMYDPEDLTACADFCKRQWQQGHELVVKPTNKDHGIGISVGIKTMDELQKAIAFAEKYTRKIIIQRRHYGADCRITVVDGVCVAAVLRVPSQITGDGQHSMAELIAIENERRLATNTERQMLYPIKEADVQRFLGDETFASVPQAGVSVAVSGTANFSRGGQVEDVTDEVHPSYKSAAIAISRELGLKVCGVDFLTTDCTQELSVDVAILLEINCSIGLRLHHYPSKGQSHDVAGAILDVVARTVKGNI